MLRIGQGFDVHQLTTQRKLIIGGVHIPFDKGLLGHSDADVLLHAITDALLGAIGQGDLGHFFPDNDSKYKDADSAMLLEKVFEKVKQEHFVIDNLDCTIIAERPKMQSYLPEMRKNIAQICQIMIQQVNIKATTMEKLGPIGAEEGIAAMVVVLLHKKA